MAFTENTDCFHFKHVAIQLCRLLPFVLNGYLLTCATILRPFLFVVTLQFFRPLVQLCHHQLVVVPRRHKRYCNRKFEISIINPNAKLEYSNLAFGLIIAYSNWALD